MSNNIWYIPSVQFMLLTKQSFFSYKIKAIIAALTYQGCCDEAKWEKLVKKHRVLSSSIKECGMNATLNLLSLYFSVMEANCSTQKSHGWGEEVMMVCNFFDLMK